MLRRSRSFWTLLLIKPGKEKAWCEMSCWMMGSWWLLTKLAIAEKLVRDDLLVRKAGERWFAGGRGCIWDRAFCQGIILICLKARLGMHFRRGNYPGLIRMSGRDDFRRGNWSWFDEKLLQGWFPAGELILTWWKAFAGMISNSGIDPDSQEISGRDDFRRGKWSWFAGNVWQGWFPAGKLILICGKNLTGMISNSGIHPDSREMPGRDAFRLWRASLP